MPPILIQKLSLLVLLLQQLAAQLGQPQSTIVPLPVLDFGRRASNGSAASKQLQLPPSIIIPTIAKVEPIEGGVGTRVTIFGDGFDRERNTVYTGAGEVVVPSPDGKTLSFTLPRPPFLSDQWLFSTADYRREHYGNEPISFPLGFYIKNQNGITVKPGLFSLTI